MVAGLLLRKYPIGADPYYFLLNAKKGIITRLMPPAFQYVALYSVGWGHIIIPPILAAISIGLLILIGRELKLRNSGLVGLALLLAPVFMFRASFFEDDILGYCFMLLAILLFLKNRVVGILALIPLALVWQGWIIVALMFGFFVLPAVAAYPMLVLLCLRLVLEYSSGVSAELVPVSIGVAVLFYPYFIPFAHLIQQKIATNELFYRWVFFTVGLSMVAMRFTVLAAFPLALLFTHAEGWKQKGVFVQGFAIALLITSMVIVPLTVPSAEMMDCIKANPEASVDGSLSYFSRWFGGDPEPLPYSSPIKQDINYASWKEDCQSLEGVFDE